MQDSMLIHLKRYVEMFVLVKCTVKIGLAYIYIEGEITK